MSIGALRCVVVNVTDAEIGARFWAALTGYEVLESGYWARGWMSYLGTTNPPVHKLILVHTDRAPIQTEAPSFHTTNRVHVDITPNEGVDRAIIDIVALGGRLKKAPSLYPRPTPTSDEEPVIDWAVMQDPFGNEFCLVQTLTGEQRAAALAAAHHGIVDDGELRAAAGQTRLSAG